MLRTQPDERLVELVREGSDSSFEVIVERYHDALMRYCRRFLDSARCEDVVQQAFTNALIFMRESDRELALRAWLYRVVHNTALKVISNKSSRDSELSTEIAGVATTGAIVESRDEFKRVISEIASLSESERRALVMRTFEGDSYEQIALALESTPNGARQMLHRVRTKLRAAAALLLPLPLLRWLAQAGDAQAATVAAGAGATGIAVKVAAAVAVGVVATGAGVVAMQSGKGTDGGDGVAVASTEHGSGNGSTTVAERLASTRRSNRTDDVHRNSGTGHSGGSGPGNSGNDDAGVPLKHKPAGSSSGGGPQDHNVNPPNDRNDPPKDKPKTGIDPGQKPGKNPPGGGSPPDDGPTTGNPSTTNVSGGKLIVAGSIDTNNFTVSRSGSRILVGDSGGPGVKPTVSGICTKVTSRQTSCPASGFGVIQIDAGRGDDTVLIDSSVDVGVDVDGSYGNDTLIADGGSNTNVLNGGQEADVVRGSPFRDALDGGTAADVIDGRGGDDSILGSAGDDRLCGSDGADSVSGGSGNDQVYGGSGTNTLRGDIGTDTVFSPAGNNVAGFEQTMAGASLSC